MAKYCFKVTVNDGNNMGILPSSLSDKSELSDFDNYVYQSGGFLYLCNKLASELNIDSVQISDIKISQIRTGLDFSPIYVNPYLTDVLSSVKKKSIIGYDNYPLDTIVVSTDSDMYKEMKDYLFYNLEKNSDKFFEEIYVNNNKFSDLLKKYVTLYKIEFPSTDDARELSNLNDKILKGLSIYRNYRSLCKNRYDYENGRVFNANRHDEPVTPVVQKSPEYDPSKFVQRPLHEMNQFTNDNGEEREEFLEIDEIKINEDDYGYGKRR